MANSRDLDVTGNRFALLQPEQSQGHTDTSASASKRRRRKSAKASTSSRSAESSTSIDGLILNGRIPLKTVSELDVLRSNSAEVNSSLDAAATFVLAPGRLERHTDADIPHHTAKRPHASFSFQDPSRGLAEKRSPQSLYEYLQAELCPEPLYPTADAIFRQTERDRVYNAIAYVPYQLERLLWYGLLLCCNSFLATFTLLPIRFVRAVACCIGWSSNGARLKGDQLFDLICVGIFVSTVLFLRQLNAGAIYFWIKDLTQEFLKLQVIYTAVEMFDKILCSFGVDTLEALSGTCTLFVNAKEDRVRQFRHLVSDSIVALLIVLMHGTVIMCQGMAFSVAMNSKRSSALVALLIASNFVEIKGTVMKRFDSSKLFKLASQDVVERFHLLISLLFVLVEEMDNSGQWLPSKHLLWQCSQIFLAEVVIDIAKHAVVGKFNEIRPGVYREFMKDVCERVMTSQSHNVHSVMDFEPFGPAALFLRVMLTFLVIRSEPLSETSLSHWGLRSFVALASWGVLCMLCACLGFVVKRLAFLYMQHYDKIYNAKAGRGLCRTERLNSESHLNKHE